MVFSLQESGLSRWVGGERFSSVHGGVIVAGVGPVAVGGGSGLVVYTVVFSLQESGLSRWGGGAV